jgi:hypothetical protein
MAEPIAARRRLLGPLACLALAAGGCARPLAAEADPSRARPPLGASLRTPGLRAPADPTVRGARLVPASVDEARIWGTVPGGGVRQIVAGLRIVSSPSGDVLAASDRLPASPSTVCELPERLGGGFLMGVGTHLWFAKTWLGPASPLFTLSAPIAEVLVGLDRVYLRSSQGPLVAIDPRTGATIDPGPLPASPRVASIAALDAWRAVAVADLRGALVTLDAGSSWRPVALPVEPLRTLAIDESFAVGGLDRARTLQWWAVLPDGQTGWLASPPGPNAPNVPAARGAGRSDSIATPLGPRPLRAAVEDGWPLTDGTALVARDGYLVRVRLADGAVVETQADAFSLKPARCHAVTLARPGDPSAFGFVCGELRGATAVLRWDAAASRLIELRRFDSPREVLSSGNGGLAVRGGCATPAAEAAGSVGGDLGAGDLAPRGRADWCLMAPDGDWSEMHFSGPDVERARLVVLSGRRVALVRPPEGGDLSSARLTLTDGVTDGARATHLPLRFETVAAEVARVLRWGVWMDGFEERRPGVLGGWVDAAGSIVGVEIALDGELRVGEYIRDAGGPVASGRWAFGWTASRGGFETTDGGMTWTKEIALPEPIAEPRVGRDVSCGPIGCLLAGWLRVGWGTAVEGLGQGPGTTGGAGAEPRAVEPPPPKPRPSHRPPPLTLDCEAAGLAPSADAPPSTPLGRLDPAARADPTLARLRLQAHSPARGLSSASSWGAVGEFRPFSGRPGPELSSGELGLSIDASHPLERGLRPRPLGRAYAWGPGAGDWHASSHWQVRWFWPWQEGAAMELAERTSAVGPAPWASLELAARSLAATAGALGVIPEWTLVPGDDPDHALLIERRGGLAASVSTNPGVVAVETLEADRAPVEVKRAEGELLPDLQGAVRSGGRWYVTTAQLAGEPAATLLWLVDDGVARELGRLPRVAPESVGPGRLVRWAGGSAGSGAPSPVGVLVSGPDADRGGVLWISSFDPESRAFGDPEPLAPADLSDRTVAGCTGDDAGWELEASYPGTVDVRVGSAWAARLQGVLARLRLSRTAACVDGVFGSADSQAAHADVNLSAARPQVQQASRTLGATVVREQGRARLRCRVVSP